MTFDYGIQILQKQRNRLEDMMDRVDRGEYSRHSEDQIESFKKVTLQRISEVTASIEQLSKREN